MCIKAFIHMCGVSTLNWFLYWWSFNNQFIIYGLGGVIESNMQIHLLKACMDDRSETMLKKFILPVFIIFNIP